MDKVQASYWLDYTIETILLEKDGKRLLIEMYFLYGVQLLLLDRLVPAIARERIVVCYVRYKHSADQDITTQVAKMCKSTGSVFNRKDRKYDQTLIPAKYPCDYFARFKVDRRLVETLINALKDDDIYNNLSAYPNPQHRSVALSQQASIIFVMLNFCPRILENEHAKMREIADKHFPDNFVI